MLDPIGVDGYRDFSVVSSGSFSTVYRAFHVRFQRTVAVKVRSAPFESDDAQRWFLSESRAAGAASGHPNMVTILDAGITGSGQPFLASEYMGRGSLGKLVAESGPLGVADVLRIGIKLAGALASLHASGAVHRDLKPQNILVSDFGEPCVTDFGISAMSGATGATGATRSPTPLFTAPEVLNGGPSTPASDIYSFGATLYALLAGHAPFQPTGPESDGQTLGRILDGSPPPPVPTTWVPPSLQNLLATCLSNRPELRPASAVLAGEHLQWIQQSLGDVITELPIAPLPGAYGAGPQVPVPPPNPPFAAPGQPLWGPSGRDQRSNHASPWAAAAPPLHGGNRTGTNHRPRVTLASALAGVIVLALVAGLSVWFTSGSSTTTSTTKPAVATNPVSTTTTVPAFAYTPSPVPGGSGNKSPSAITTSADCPSDLKATLNKPAYPNGPTGPHIDTSKTYTATVKTDVGSFTITLAPKAAPLAVNSFVFLARQHFFDCIIFHRVIPGFVDQTGDPTGTGTGGPGYSFADELPPKANPQYPLGSVAMANSGPNTNGSQFFVVTGPLGESIPPSSTVFGQVTSGMSVAQKINADGTTGGTPKVLHRIISITISES